MGYMGESPQCMFLGGNYVVVDVVVVVVVIVVVVYVVVVACWSFNCMSEGSYLVSGFVAFLCLVDFGHAVGKSLIIDCEMSRLYSPLCYLF